MIEKYTETFYSEEEIRSAENTLSTLKKMKIGEGKFSYNSKEYNYMLLDNDMLIEYFPSIVHTGASGYPCEVGMFMTDKVPEIYRPLLGILEINDIPLLHDKIPNSIITGVRLCCEYCFEHNIDIQAAISYLKEYLSTVKDVRGEDNFFVSEVEKTLDYIDHIQGQYDRGVEGSDIVLNHYVYGKKVGNESLYEIPELGEKASDSVNNFQRYLDANLQATGMFYNNGIKYPFYVGNKYPPEMETGGGAGFLERTLLHLTYNTFQKFPCLVDYTLQHEIYDKLDSPDSMLLAEKKVLDGIEDDDLRKEVIEYHLMFFGGVKDYYENGNELDDHYRQIVDTYHYLDSL